MNYKELTKGLTVRQFNEIAENWYTRLNNLKQWLVANRSHPKYTKCIKLIGEMITRMGVIAHFYMQVNRPIPKVNFKKGTAIIGEVGAEVIINKRTTSVSNLPAS